jgi:hypothetical protein
MDFFHHQTIRKYTASLLDTFNDIYIQRTDKNNNLIYHNVPVTFGSKDKAFVFSELDLEQWKSGNYNILPRMSLSLLSMTADTARNTNRLHVINKTINGNNISFQYNAVAYKLKYQLDIATKSLTELSMVLEQILPYFNPSLNINVMELDILEEPTSIKISLDGVDLDLPEGLAVDAELRIVGARLSLSLYGNIYMPFKDSAVIKLVRLYLNSQQDTEILGTSDRKEKIEFDVVNGEYKDRSMYKLDFIEKDTVAKNAPNYMYSYDSNGNKIRDNQNIPVLIKGGLYITGNSTVSKNTQSNYKLNFVDCDDEDHFTYIWNILQGKATIFQNNVNPVIINFGAVGAVVLQGQVIDRNGNISNFATYNITVQ